MIEMPQRSVTRFFIPLIDVLTLLFCVFLVMPLAKPAEGEGESTSDKDRLRRLEEENERLRASGAGRVEEMQKELAELKKAKAATLQERLQPVVLQIEGSDGRLFYTRDRKPVVLDSEAAVRAMVERDRQRFGGREVMYVILFPRVRSRFPTVEQFDRYDAWFANVVHKFDEPE